MTGPTERSGFSLMEVLLATAILLGSVIALSELARIGRLHVNSVERLTTAQRLCQNKLNELLAGLTSIETVEAEPLDVALADDTSLSADLAEEPTWLFSVDVEPLDRPGLVSVRVTVWQAATEDQQEADDEDRRRKAFSLVRWMREPFAVDTEGTADVISGTGAFASGFDGATSR